MRLDGDTFVCSQCGRARMTILEWAHRVREVEAMFDKEKQAHLV